MQVDRHIVHRAGLYVSIRSYPEIEHSSGTPSSHAETGQEHRVRRRFAQMLLRENMPREYREYAKPQENRSPWDACAGREAGVNRNNPYVMRYYSYLSLRGT